LPVLGQKRHFDYVPERDDADLAGKSEIEREKREKRI